MAKKTKADLDDGYIRVANTLFLALLKLPIFSYEARVLLFVIYQTYGYNHKERELSNRYIGNGLGIDAANVSRAIKKLTSMNVIKKTLNGKRRTQILGVNTHVDEWVTVVTSDNTTVVTSDNTTVVTSDNTTVVTSDNKYNTDQNQTDKNQTECVGAAQAPPPHTPDFVCFDRLWGEWKFSQAGKNRITKKQRHEIEIIGYYRMADAAERYYQDFENRTTKNNIPLSARTWFEGAYKQYLSDIDGDGIWYDTQGFKLKGGKKYE